MAEIKTKSKRKPPDHCFKKGASGNPVGRPSEYNDDVVAEFCLLVSEGVGISKICQREDMPSKQTIFNWLARNKEFVDQYARAKEMCADKYAEDILDIADDGKSDTYVDDNGNQRTDHEVVGRSRLRVDARKWLASKLAPKKYGEKITTEVSGTLNVRDATDLTDDELAAIATGRSN